MKSNALYKRSQKERLAKTIQLAGPRYTPELNVPVSIAAIFDGLGRTKRFYESLKQPAIDIVKNLRSISDGVRKAAPKEFKEAEDASASVAHLLTEIPLSGVEPINYTVVLTASAAAQETIQKCFDQLALADEQERLRRTAGEGPSAREQRRGEDEPFRNDKYHLYKVTEALLSLDDFLASKTALAANNPRIILSGVAGSGKTHFLCDLAQQRLGESLPTYVFLGEEIADRNPWRSVARLLGVQSSQAEFLSALDSYAAARKSRAIVIIDAINERKIAGVRWSYLNKLCAYRHLGFVLSIRSGFEPAELAAAFIETCIRVEHQGFATHEWQALTKFFTRYGLPLPEVPLLFPEFRIPLFLKIFCEAFADSDKPIRGHYGFTHIFEQYVKRQGKAILNRLGQPSNAGESHRRVWDGVVKEVALYMGRHGTDRIPEDEALAVTTKEFASQGPAALEALEKAFLITKIPRYNQPGFDYRFPYQKFSDHLIARNLLNQHLAAHKTRPEEAFRRGTKLHEIIKSGWLNRGLIEALAIQVPERLRGRELIHVAPRRFRNEQIAKETFLESLIWRDLSLTNGKPKFIRRKSVLQYLNKCILPYHGGDEQIFETILTICAVPHHPLNALLLHSHLSRFKLAERDSFWLPYLNGRYGSETAVDRLIVWAWDSPTNSVITDEPVRLAGIALAWFFASSNRFLRDRATKALASLVRSRVRALIAIMKTFEAVNDPYINERLYAVACGTALNPTLAPEDASKLGRYVYEAIFKQRRPTVHVLLRDYARGAVEACAARDPNLRDSVDLDRTLPPYASTFPSRIPSLAHLRRKYYPEKQRRSPQRISYSSIWYSLMYNNGGGIADFGNYVVNTTVGHWCNIPLPKNATRPPTTREMAAEFRRRLRRSQKRTWRELERKRQSIHLSAILRDMPLEGLHKPSADDIESEARRHADAEAAFVDTLPESVRELYRKGIVASRDRSADSNELDKGAIQRIIFRTIVRLGWRPELFAEYDANVRDVGREGHKIERIGKKYQWIAFHETLARIADNFCFREDFGNAIRPYSGPWQAWERDLDPSCLMSRTPTESGTGKPWWVSAEYNSWRLGMSDTQWTRLKSDLPNQSKLLQVRRDGCWLTLGAFFRWQQPVLPGEERFAFDRVQRDAWYLVNAYLVRRSDGERIFAWAKQQNFMGRWMPDPIDTHNVFLREIPFFLAYRQLYDPRNRPRWTFAIDREDRSIKFPMLSTTETYSWEGSGFDCSIDEGLRIRMPAHELVKGLRLRQTEATGVFVDPNGKAIVIDPSVAEAGPSVLLVKKKPFLAFLTRKDYEVLWTVIGEKALLGEPAGGRRFLGRLEMGGAFRMQTSGKIAGKTYTKWLPPHDD